MSLQAHCLVSGTASGELLFSHVGLSFWAGVNSCTGQIIDHHHPLCGSSLMGRVLAIPSGRGSCSGSSALLELLVSDHGPTGMIFSQREDILTLGVLVAKAMFDLSIPVVILSPSDFATLEGKKYVRINGRSVTTSDDSTFGLTATTEAVDLTRVVELSTIDGEMLRGTHGPAKQIAMETLLGFAHIQGAKRLLDVSQAHIDACVYTGPAGLRFAQKLCSLGAKVAVPTTLNSISIDKRRWRELGLSSDVVQPADDLAKAYLAMGAKISFTCAPYLLETAPKLGEQIGWAESNAVVFANSILGARTQKYPDFLDVCISLTGRAPSSGCHQDQGRLPTLLVTLPSLYDPDDSLYPTLGYHIGKLVGSEIPFIKGLELTSPDVADLKAFSAAFATTSSAAMFHIRGITPESAKMEKVSLNLKTIMLSHKDLAACYRALNTALDSSVQLVSLGNPHFSIDEFAKLAQYCVERRKHASVDVIVTTSRWVLEQAEMAGYREKVANFGVEVITDTCWCMIDEPVISPSVRNLMTNSAKYAHYGPGMIRRGIHFGSLRRCVDAACTGTIEATLPAWLEPSTPL